MTTRPQVFTFHIRPQRVLHIPPHHPLQAGKGFCGNGRSSAIGTHLREQSTYVRSIVSETVKLWDT